MNGLYLSGVVTSRTRQQKVDKNGEPYEIVRYTLMSEGELTKVVDMDPEEYYAIGQDVTVPVRPNPFQNQYGSLSVSLMVNHGYKGQGEAF